MSNSNKQTNQVSDPYAGYETKSTTTRTNTDPTTPIGKYRAYVHKHMELGVKKFGVQVEEQDIHKCNDKTNMRTTKHFSGHCFIKNITVLRQGKEHKVYEFIIPSLYMKGCGDNHTKRVVNEETQRIEDTHATLGKLPIEDK